MHSRCTLVFCRLLTDCTKILIFSLAGWFCIVIGCSDQGLVQSIAWLMLHSWLRTRFIWRERLPNKVDQGCLGHQSIIPMFIRLLTQSCGQPHASCGQWSLPGPEVPCLADSSSLMQPTNQSITWSFHLHRPSSTVCWLPLCCYWTRLVPVESTACNGWQRSKSKRSGK